MDVATTNKDDDDSRSSLNTTSLSMARQQPVEIVSGLWHDRLFSMI